MTPSTSGLDNPPDFPIEDTPHIPLAPHESVTTLTVTDTPHCPPPPHKSITHATIDTPTTIQDYDTQILTLQHQIDRDLAKVRHLVASRAVAIEHERALRKIDTEYSDPAERKKILERVEGAQSSHTQSAPGRGGGKASKGGMSGGKIIREKPGLILYGKRVLVKKDVKKESVKKDIEEEKQAAVRRLS